MKKTTFQKLLFLIICASLVSTTHGVSDDKKEKKEKNELKLNLDIDVAGSSLSHNLEGTYYLPLGDGDTDSPIKSVKITGKLKNPLSQKPYRAVFDDTSNTFMPKLEKFSKLLSKIACVGVFSIGEEEEIIAEVGVKGKVVLKGKSIYGIVKAKNLAGNTNVGLTIAYNDPTEATWEALGVILDGSKKGIATEEDSITGKVALSIVKKDNFYTCYGSNKFGEHFLGRLGSVNVSYKTGDKESIFNSASLSYTAPIKDDTLSGTLGGSRIGLDKGNSPSIKLTGKFNNAGVIQESIASVWESMPEKFTEIFSNCELKSINLGLTKRFYKKAGGNNNDRNEIAGIKENWVVNISLSYKNLLPVKDTTVKVGISCSPMKAEHDYMFGFSFSVEKEIELFSEEK